MNQHDPMRSNFGHGDGLARQQVQAEGDLPSRAVTGGAEPVQFFRLGWAGTVPLFLVFLITLQVTGVFAREHFYVATNLWKANVGIYNKSSPALDTNGNIYLTTWDGRLLALSPDGTHRWQFKFGGESVSSPAIDAAGSIYFGSRNKSVYSVAPDGKKRWRFPTGGWVDASPALGGDGAVYFGSWDKKFYALTSEGKQRWAFATGGPIVSSAAIDADGIIYFGSHDRKFYALNPDGSLRWEFATPGAITASPAIGRDGELYISSTAGQLYRLGSDGKLQWRLQTGGITASSPVVGTDGVIFISVNQTHCAVSPEGKFLWQRAFWHPQTNYFGENAAAVVADGTVIFTGGDGFVMTVPVDNGEKDFIWNYFLYGASYSSPLVSSDGTVYAIALPRELHALKNGHPLVSSSWPTFRGNSQRTGRVPAR
jgi:outer membrane protein assembly factor BamB